MRRINGLQTRWPELDVRLLVNGTQCKFAAVVDTGAAITLAEWEVADELGLLQSESDVAAAPWQSWRDAGGRETVAYGVTLDLDFGENLVLHDTTVFFTKERIPTKLLLGQRDVLERLDFVHINRKTNPYFVLADRERH